MPLPQQKSESLLRYATRLADQLSLIRPGAIHKLLPNVLSGLCRRLHVPHAQMFAITERRGMGPCITWISGWSEMGLESLHLQEMRGEPLGLFVGGKYRDDFLEGVPLFCVQGTNQHACTRMIATAMRDFQVTGYDMLPILIHGKVRAVFAFAHDKGPTWLEGPHRTVVQLIGRVVMNSWLSARRELRRQRAYRHWKRVADGACDFALRVSEHLRITDVIAFRDKNPPAARGMLIHELIAPGSLSGMLEELSAAVADQSPRLTEFRSITSSGTPCSYSARIEPDHSSHPQGAILYLTNNDRERAYAEEVESLRHQLERAARLSMLGNIATEFAHQLAQPMQAVTNHLFTLKSRTRRFSRQPASQLETISRIEECLNHAGNIIRGVRDFLQNQRYHIEETLLVPLIDRSLVMVQSKAQMSGVAVLFEDRDRFVGVKAWIDSDQTMHVLTNLLINAIEAMVDAAVSRPRLAVRLNHDVAERLVEVEIRDNGPGIPEDRLARVFERFFSTKKEGFGVGLAMCRDIVEKQGGHITVQNLPTCGCVFRFTLPADDPGEELSMEEELDA